MWRWPTAVGTGVADDKAIYPFVPDMIKFYLGQDAILPNVPTYICAATSDRKYVLEHLDELVVKSTNESGGYGMLMGHQADSAERENFAEKIADDPRNFIAQPVVELSQHPSLVRRPLRRPPHRSSAVHSVWREGDRHARRADPRRPPQRQPGGQFQPGRRQQGHLGAGRRGADRGEFVNQLTTIN